MMDWFNEAVAQRERGHQAEADLTAAQQENKQLRAERDKAIKERDHEIRAHEAAIRHHAQTIEVNEGLMVALRAEVERLREDRDYYAGLAGSPATQADLVVLQAERDKLWEALERALGELTGLGQAALDKYEKECLVAATETLVAALTTTPAPVDGEER